MGYVGLSSNTIYAVDQAMLMNSMDATVNQSVFKTTSSGFVKQNTDDDYKISNVVASKNAAYQYDNYLSLRNSLNTDLSEYQDGQDNFASIRDKVAEIKSIINSAFDGTLVGTELDDAQDQINTLVKGIEGLVDISTVDKRKIFDGTFTRGIQQDLSGNTTMDVDSLNLNIDTTLTSAGSLGFGSTVALNNLTVSENRTALGGAQGLATSTTLDDINAIQDNLTRMGADLDSMVARVSKVSGRVNDKMNILKDQKANVDLSLGGYFNASNINVQMANHRKALDLLP
jgi:hypothetical protein